LSATYCPMRTKRHVRATMSRPMLDPSSGRATSMESDTATMKRSSTWNGFLKKSRPLTAMRSVCSSRKRDRMPTETYTSACSTFGGAELLVGRC